MNKDQYSQGKSAFFVALIFVFMSVIIGKVMPVCWLVPDLSLILTIYAALAFDGKVGMLLSVFGGGYVGSFSSFPLEYMAFYGLIFFGIRFISSYFQLRFLGYPVFLTFFLEVLVGTIHGLEIYLKQPEVFSFQPVERIVFFQALLTTLFLYPVFLLFKHVSRNFSLPVKRPLK